MGDIDPQQFGELRATVVALERTIDSLNADMKALNAAVKELTDQLSQARGGWRVLLIMGAVAAALASFADWFFSHISVRP